MGQHTTKQQLDFMVKLVNRQAGFDPNHIDYSTLHSYALDKDIAGYRLVQIVNDSGAERTITEPGTKAQCFAQVRAFYHGMRAML